MIIDTLENLPLYAHLNPRFQKVIDFLSENDINQLPEGKHLIDGENVFVNIQMATGKAPDVAVLETHRKMIDIQIPLSAPELPRRMATHLPSTCRSWSTTSRKTSLNIPTSWLRAISPAGRVCSPSSARRMDMLPASPSSRNSKRLSSK